MPPTPQGAEIEKTKAETEKMQSESGKAYLDYEKALGSRNKDVYTEMISPKEQLQRLKKELGIMQKTSV